MQRAAEMRQNDAQFGAQLRQHATDRDVQMFDRQQQRAVDLQQGAWQQQADLTRADMGYEQKQLQADAAIEREQIQQRGQRAQQYDQTVQAGLKSGELYYSAQQRQQLAEHQRNVGQIYADTSIDPAHQDAMADHMFQRMRSIVPMVRSQDEIPTPVHQKVAEQVSVMTNDGRVVPIGQLGRGLKDGDVIVTGTVRNGAMAYSTKPFAANKADDPYADFSHPLKLNKIRADLARDIQSDLDAEHDNALADWELRKEQHESTSAGPFLERRPSKRRPTPDEIDARLYEMSGGVAGRDPAAIQQEQGGRFWRGVAGAVNDMLPPVPVRTTDEAMRLPVGTRFIAPDGRIGIVAAQ